jgi:predicted O-methyltransferase YrrM
MKELLLKIARCTVFPLMDAYVVERFIPLMQERIIKSTRNQQLILGGQTTARYIIDHMSACPMLESRPAGLISALDAAPSEGLVMEFGVSRGESINLLAERLPSQKVHGFDSFKGLPEAWHVSYASGAFEEEDGWRPAVRDNVELHVGWFNETLPGFLEAHPGPIRLLHVDSDLYSSAKYVFDTAGDRIVSGTVIVFDEYFNYPGWEDHEYKAFQEFLAQRGLKYEYLSYTLNYTQVVVKIV